MNKILKGKWNLPCIITEDKILYKTKKILMILILNIYKIVVINGILLIIQFLMKVKENKYNYMMTRNK